MSGLTNLYVDMFCLLWVCMWELRVCRKVFELNIWYYIDGSKLLILEVLDNMEGVALVVATFTFLLLWPISSPMSFDIIFWKKSCEAITFDCYLPVRLNMIALLSLVPALATDNFLDSFLLRKVSDKFCWLYLQEGTSPLLRCLLKILLLEKFICLFHYC